MDVVKICEVVDGCEDCPKYGDDCDGDKMAEHTDYISRADAIEAIMKHHDGELDQINFGLMLAKNEIQALPSADEQVIGKLKNPCDSLLTDDSAECKEQRSKLESAEAIQGEWIWRTDIPIGDGRTSAGYICSNCGKVSWHGNVFNYCPSCGSRMKGGDSE